VLVDFGPDTAAITKAVAEAKRADKTADEIAVVQTEHEKSDRVTFAVLDLSRILTSLYFLFFFAALPALGRFETPLPLPESISKAVLGKASATAAA